MNYEDLKRYLFKTNVSTRCIDINSFVTQLIVDYNESIKYCQKQRIKST